jgi:hypothetical protein
MSHAVCIIIALMGISFGLGLAVFVAVCLLEDDANERDQRRDR